MKFVDIEKVNVIEFDFLTTLKNIDSYDANLSHLKSFFILLNLNNNLSKINSILLKYVNLGKI